MLSKHLVFRGTRGVTSGGVQGLESGCFSFIVCDLAICQLPFDHFPSQWMGGASVLNGFVPRLEVFGNSWLDVPVLECYGKLDNKA